MSSGQRRCRKASKLPWLQSSRPPHLALRKAELYQRVGLCSSLLSHRALRRQRRVSSGWFPPAHKSWIYSVRNTKNYIDEYNFKPEMFLAPVLIKPMTCPFRNQRRKSLRNLPGLKIDIGVGFLIWNRLWNLLGREVGFGSERCALTGSNFAAGEQSYCPTPQFLTANARWQVWLEFLLKAVRSSLPRRFNGDRAAGRVETSAEMTCLPRIKWKEELNEVFFCRFLVLPELSMSHGYDRVYTI